MYRTYLRSTVQWYGDNREWREPLSSQLRGVKGH